MAHPPYSAFPAREGGPALFIAPLLLSLLAVGGPASAQIDYFADFNAGLAGWTVLAGTHTTSAPNCTSPANGKPIRNYASNEGGPWVVYSPELGISNGLPIEMTFRFMRTTSGALEHMNSWMGTSAEPSDNMTDHTADAITAGGNCGTYTATLPAGAIPAGQPVFVMLGSSRQGNLIPAQHLFDDVRVLQCAVPNGGVIDPVAAICTGRTATLISRGANPAINPITLQWEESDDGGVTDPWGMAVGGSGANNTNIFITPALSAARHYRLRAECMMGGPPAYSNEVRVEVAPCAGINEAHGGMSVRWLGQDADGSHMLRTAGAIVLGWEVLDAAGRAISFKDGVPTRDLHRLELDGIPSGAYLLRVRSDQGIAMVRIMHVAR